MLTYLASDGDSACTDALHIQIPPPSTESFLLIIAASSAFCNGKELAEDLLPAFPLTVSLSIGGTLARR